MVFTRFPTSLVTCVGGGGWGRRKLELKLVSASVKWGQYYLSHSVIVRIKGHNNTSKEFSIWYIVGAQQVLASAITMSSSGGTFSPVYLPEGAVSGFLYVTCCYVSGPE